MGSNFSADATADYDDLTTDWKALPKADQAVLATFTALLGAGMLLFLVLFILAKTRVI